MTLPRTPRRTPWPSAPRTLAGALLAGLLVAAPAQAADPAKATEPAKAADPAELTAVWKHLYGGGPRGQIQHTVTGAGGAFHVPVTTFLPGEDGNPFLGADGRESVWTVDPATGERGPEEPALQMPADGFPSHPSDPYLAHVRDLAVLPGGDRLLLVGRIGLGRWRLIRRTAAGETLFEKSLWKDPHEELQRYVEEMIRLRTAQEDLDLPLMARLQERASVQLFNIVPVSDGEFLLIGLRTEFSEALTDLSEIRNQLYAVRVTADGERVWDRSFDCEPFGEPNGALLPDGRIVLTVNTTHLPGPESEDPHVGVLVIDSGGDVVRRTVFLGAAPSVCVTESGRPVVASWRVEEKAIACFARGLDPDTLDTLWETPPLMPGKWLLSSPKIVAVPGGFAVATSSFTELFVAQCSDDGAVRAVGSWSDKLMRAPTLTGAVLACEGGTLAAFWTVLGPDGTDPARSQQVGGVGFTLVGEPD